MSKGSLAGHVGLAIFCVAIGYQAGVRNQSKPVSSMMGKPTGVPERPEQGTVAGEAFKKATETNQKAEAEPTKSDKKPLEKTPVDGIMDKREDGSWTLAFHLLSVYPNTWFECEADDVTVVFDKSLDGTYISAVHHYNPNPYQSMYQMEGVILYVSTPENNRNWNVYLKKMKDQKKASESPREVIPPGYIKIRPDDKN